MLHNPPHSHTGVLGDWADDDDILAQVLAASEQEYFDSCRVNAANVSPAAVGHGSANSSGHASANSGGAPSTSKENCRI